MTTSTSTPDISVIVPARNEEACLADCLRTLVGQDGPNYEIIVVDDDSTDGTRAIAENFPVRVITADALPEGWSGKCNAAWSGAKIAQGQWLLFTDADTKHAPNSIASGLQEAKEAGAGLLSYSPKQEVGSLAERALLPLIFGELATKYPPKEVCDPNSPVAAANGQYLLIRRDVYDAIGGHAAVATAILEDVELAKRAKQAGYKSCTFAQSDAVSYPHVSQLWRDVGRLDQEPGACCFPIRAAWRCGGRSSLLVIVVAALFDCRCRASGRNLRARSVNRCRRYCVMALSLLGSAFESAHFDWSVKCAVADFGLPLFAVLLSNSDISHKRGSVRWKGREYDP